MKYIFIFLCCVSFQNCALAQFDAVIKSLIKPPSNSPKTIKGYFKPIQVRRSDRDLICYQFSRPKPQFGYFPKQVGLDCGYIEIEDQVFYLTDSSWQSKACDLDYGSFQLFGFKLGKKKYLIFLATRYGSGMTSSFTYCVLLNISDSNNIKCNKLATFYGSCYSFGDYDNDGEIDFLEIGYDPESITTDNFILRMKTCTDGGRFILQEDKMIKFKRTYKKNGDIAVTKIESVW